MVSTRAFSHVLEKQEKLPLECFIVVVAVQTKVRERQDRFSVSEKRRSVRETFDLWM